MPRNRVWFIPVLINDTHIPDHRISGHETLKAINAVKLFDDWQEGLRKILRAMNLDDPDHRRAMHLIDLIRHHPAERAHAIEQLVSMSTAAAEAVPALSEALRDTDGSVRRSAAEALGKIGPPAVPALSEALRDTTDEMMRSYAAGALKRIKLIEG